MIVSNFKFLLIRKSLKNYLKLESWNHYCPGKIWFQKLSVKFLFSGRFSRILERRTPFNDLPTAAWATIILVDNQPRKPIMQSETLPSSILILRLGLSLAWTWPCADSAQRKISMRGHAAQEQETKNETELWNVTMKCIRFPGQW